MARPKDYFIPQLVLTGLSSGNTSTAWFDFIQTNNVDHWGEYPSGSLLTRLNNPAQATTNRNAMCAGFTANPLQTNDSCDEFPMASTYQSGNMLGLSPSDCSQGVPEYISAANEWEFIMYPGYSPSRRCGIGHVNLNDNSSTGGQYGNFILNNRLLDGDPFWLGFTN
jgi:hypothetical protein